MAAIVFTSQTGSGRYQKLRTNSAATTTDWIQTPPWASIAIVHLDISAAGTSTILTLKAAPPWTLDDARAITFLTSATITAASYHTYTIYPNATAVADAVGASTMVVAAAHVPAILGITTTPNTSTYSTAIEFRAAR